MYICNFVHICLRKIFLSPILHMQIKFLEDIKKGKVDTKHHSRGVAFVEFAEHQHALVALRVLNNNPGNIVLICYYPFFSPDIMIGSKSIIPEILIPFIL